MSRATEWFGVLRLVVARFQKLRVATFHYEDSVFYRVSEEKKRVSRYPRFSLTQNENKS